jgi:hypothetical protein
MEIGVAYHRRHYLFDAAKLWIVEIDRGLFFPSSDACHFFF